MKTIDEPTARAELYATPLDQFTATRNELAARLKAEGNEEAAARVKALKKPSVSAWAVNQLVRTRELDLARLLRAGEGLEQAQRDVLSGKANDFDKARKEEGAAVRALMAAAKDLVPSLSAAILDRVANTLRAAASAEGREKLKSGKLTEDLEPPGFEAFSGFTAPSSSRAAVKPPDRKLQALIDRREAAREELKTAQAEARKLEKDAKAAEAVARKAGLAAAAASKRADLAAGDLHRIEDDLAKLK